MPESDRDQITVFLVDGLGAIRARVNGAAYPKDEEDHMMNQDVFEGKWKQVLRRAREWWGTLRRRVTNHDLDRGADKFDKFFGLLQDKYGPTREHSSEEEFKKRAAEYEAIQIKSVAPTP